MKNFTQSIRGFYAAAILMVVMLSTAFSVTAQPVTWPQRKPFANQPYEVYSQMWNYNSTTWYFGTVTFTPGSGVPNSTNYGRQLDSSTSGGIITLGTSILKAGKVNADTAVLQSIPGYGSLNLTSSVLAVSGSPTVTATVMSSSDGWVWAPVPGITVATFTPTSLTVPVIQKWPITVPLDRFYAIWYDGGGGDDYSAQSWWYFQRIYNISLQK